MKVAWLIQNLVPYHHARFEAYAGRPDVDAHLVQVTDKDQFSVLEFESSHRSYTLHTLFEGAARASISAADLTNALDRCLSGVKPDCVCVSGWGMEIGWVMHAWALGHGIPVVLFSESTAYDEPRKFWKEWIKTRLVGTCPAALVGGTPHAEYIQQLGMDPTAVSLGHNVVDSAYFSARVSDRLDGLPAWLEEEPYFVSCTRFGEKKNLPRLVRAYAAYVRRCAEEGAVPIKLVIAGDGELRGQVEREIGNEALSNQVVLLGAVGYAVLPWLYQNSQAFIHASTTEQWGLVVNEAMAAGVPVLVSERCGSAPNLIVGGRNGFTFDPLSEEDMAGCLWRFSHLDDGQRAAMGEAGKSIITEWGPGRFAEGLERAVAKAMASGARRNTAVAVRLLRHLMKRGAQCG